MGLFLCEVVSCPAQAWQQTLCSKPPTHSWDATCFLPGHCGMVQQSHCVLIGSSAVGGVLNHGWWAAPTQVPQGKRGGSRMVTSSFSRCMFSPVDCSAGLPSASSLGAFHSSCVLHENTRVTGPHPGTARPSPRLRLDSAADFGTRKGRGQSQCKGGPKTAARKDLQHLLRCF